MEGFGKKPEAEKNSSEKEKKMKVVCAWCGKELGFKEGNGGISHGICETCKEKVKKELEQIKREGE